MNADKEKIKSWLSRSLRGHAVGDDTDIFASGFVNSLFAMQLVMLVEKQFGITVEDEDLEIQNFSSVNAIIALIERKRVPCSAAQAVQAS